MDSYFYNPVVSDDQGQDHGDPFVLSYLGTYYMYHTGVNGIHLYTSNDLANWEYRGIVLHPSSDPAHWAQIDLWAPEVMYHNGTFYMYVAGTRRLPDGTGDDLQRRLGIARADSPEGPFVWDPKPLVHWEWSIDGHPYRDTDGTTWLFYNIRTDATRYKDGTTGCGNVVDRLVRPDVLEGKQDPVTFPTERWEGSKDGSWYWNEGAFTLKRRGIYYQMYSGGHFADDTYGIGFATAPTPRGPWKKYEGNPIFRTGDTIAGPGHHCVVRAPDQVTLYAVYHGYIPGEKGRKVHIDRLFWVGDRIHIAGPTSGPQLVPPAPVFDPRVPHGIISAWVKGNSVVIDSHSLDLNPAGYHNVKAVYTESQVTVYVDGEFRGTHLSTGNRPRLAADRVRALTQTSCIDDETLHELPDGRSVKWRWGGEGKLEVCMAIRGKVQICVDGEQSVEESRSGTFNLIQKTFHAGAEWIEVKGLTANAAVTDVTVVARE